MRFPPDVILVYLRGYAVYPLSYRHLEKMMQDTLCAYWPFIKQPQGNPAHIAHRGQSSRFDAGISASAPRINRRSRCPSTHLAVDAIPPVSDKSSPPIVRGLSAWQATFQAQKSPFTSFP